MKTYKIVRECLLLGAKLGASGGGVCLQQSFAEGRLKKRCTPLRFLRQVTCPVEG
ncbi:hypothetical protein [Siminovitchia fordii]|uniref:hypothetical protein n=1 Tax=Siminovitchia fordii TaxID=254759 RepID=UPI001BB3A85B|nr:hypothetical protein [Siminovitchia fordii]